MIRSNPHINRLFHFLNKLGVQNLYGITNIIYAYQQTIYIRIISILPLHKLIEKDSKTIYISFSPRFSLRHSVEHMADGRYNLNGGRYGPPVKTYHSHGRRGADAGCGICSCCLDCFLCFGGCILNIVCCILTGIAVVLGIVALILWFTFRPNVVKFQVTEANLTRFDLDPQSNNLHYNLSLNFSIRNPNQRLGIHYDQLEARGYYGDQRFAAVNLPSFYQGHKNTTVIGTELNGQSLVLLGHGGRSDLREDQKSGVYRIDVKLRFKIRFKFGFLKSWAFKPKIKCHLKVPLSSSTSAGGFQFHPTKCHVDL